MYSTKFCTNNTNPMSLDQKLREELSMGESSEFGGFLGVGANGVDLKKSPKVKNTIFFIIQSTLNKRNTSLFK